MRLDGGWQRGGVALLRFRLTVVLGKHLEDLVQPGSFLPFLLLFLQPFELGLEKKNRWEIGTIRSADIVQKVFSHPGANSFALHSLGRLLEKYRVVVLYLTAPFFQLLFASQSFQARPVVGRRGSTEVSGGSDGMGPLVMDGEAVLIEGRGGGLGNGGRGSDGSASLAENGARRQGDGGSAGKEHFGGGGLVPALLLLLVARRDVILVPLVLGQRPRMKVLPCGCKKTVNQTS